MTDLTALKAANGRRWAVAKPIRDAAGPAKRLVAAKQRYVTVSLKTGVPWFVIAVIHEREASQRWDTQLGQGDPLHSVSVHVPKGRGPFDTWEQGAIDALSDAALWTDWSAAGALTMAEKYNGLGYANRGVPSPYVWAGTNQYAAGKYVRDGVYDPSVVDQQLGCAALIMAMMAIDPTITFTGVAIVPPKTAPVEKPGPSITNPAKGSIGDFIAKLFATFFKRK